MICSKCGYVSLDSDLFCIKCGNPLKKLEEPVQVSEPAEEETSPISESIIESAAPAEEMIAEEQSFMEPESVEAYEPEEPIAEDSASDEESEPFDEFREEASDKPAVEPEPIVAEQEEPAEDVSEPAAAPEAEPVKSYFTPTEKVVAPLEEAAVPAEPKRAKKAIIPRLEKPLSVWGFLWRTVLFCIPVINIIPLFVFAFASGINKNSKNYASAILVLMLIGLIIAVCAAFLVFARTDPTVLHDFILKYFRLSIEF